VIPTLGYLHSTVVNEALVAAVSRHDEKVWPGQIRESKAIAKILTLVAAEGYRSEFETDQNLYSWRFVDHEAHYRH